MVDHIVTPDDRRLAYVKTRGRGPGVVFLGGFMSDMTGTKAVHLESWCRATDRAFLRFDYSGHGQSSGAFTDGCIGDWVADARHAITTLTEGPQIVVGSSMGGWIALLLARAMPERFAGLVTIAAAPDFTEDGYWAGFSADQRQALETQGQVDIPSDYGDPYPITKRLIEDGRRQLVLRDPLPLPMPTRFLQGTADTEVPTAWATRLLTHATGPDMRLTLVKDGDHRFSSPALLDLTTQTIADMLSV